MKKPTKRKRPVKGTFEHVLSKDKALAKEVRKLGARSSGDFLNDEGHRSKR